MVDGASSWRYRERHLLPVPLDHLPLLDEEGEQPDTGESIGEAKERHKR